MRITIKVIPRSSKNEVMGEMADGTIKVKLTVAPVDGKANEALIELLSKHFKCKKSAIQIVSGHTTTRKIITIIE